MTKKYWYAVTIGIYDEATGSLVEEFCEGNLSSKTNEFIDADVNLLLKDTEYNNDD
jgi:hypothetical protein